MKLLALCGVFLVLIANGWANPVLQGPSDSIFQANLAANCPSGYSQPANANSSYCYKVNADYKTKRNAANQCKLDGGTLASVPNAFVNQYLYYLASQADATAVWLGIECFNGDANSCMTDDGSNLGYNSFKPGQPNAFENCVYLSAHGRDSQQWSTFDCGQGFAYACEVAQSVIPVIPTTTTRGWWQTPTPTPIVPVTNTNTPSEWSQSPTPVPSDSPVCPMYYSEFQGMCYRFVQKIGTANDAFTQCRQLPGGNLATISSAQVNGFLLQLQSSVVGNGNPYTAFGLTCTNVVSHGDRSSCRWNDGTPFVYNALTVPNPSASGCCDFNRGNWNGCYSCTETNRFTAYFCQAPMQQM